MKKINEIIHKIKKVGILTYIRHILDWKLFHFQIQIHNKIYITLSKIINKPPTYIIGDSHAVNFRYCPFKIICYFGPVTAYNLINDNSTTKSKQQMCETLKNIPSKSKIMLSFGEIDCRAQIPYIANKKKESIHKIIKKTIERYELGIKKIQETHKKIFIFNAIPTDNNEIIFSTVKADPNLNSKILINIKKEFNKELEKMCKKNKLKFINTFNETTDNQGFMKNKFSRKDGVHYNYKATKIANKKIL